jgi:protein-tyrosine phosphatase
MIDIHSHLLPGVDEGPKSWEESLRLCRALVDDGITTAVATPHVIDRVYPNTATMVRAFVGELNERLAAAAVPLTVLPGGEIQVSCRHLTEPPFDSLPTLAGHRYLLLELPAAFVPPSLENLLFSLLARGVFPVIAHPERCIAVQTDLRLAHRWRRAGAVLQVDAESLLGLFGDATARAARGLVLAGLAHALASDSHSCHRRPPRLAAAAVLVTRMAGPDVARFLVEEGPARLVAGRPAADPPAPDESRRRERPWTRWARGWPWRRRRHASPTSSSLTSSR